MPEANPPIVHPDLEALQVFMDWGNHSVRNYGKGAINSINSVVGCTFPGPADEAGHVSGQAEVTASEL